MRDYMVFCAMLIICGGLTLTSIGQKKPQNERQNPATQSRQVVSPEENKIPVRHLFEDMFSRGRYEMIDQVFAKGIPVHFGNRNVRLDQAVSEGKGWRSAAPDLVMSIDQISANGDMVAVSWTARGTHTGQGNGLKPTGKRVFMHGRSEFKVVNGKIVEAWNEEYRPELLRQLGVSKAQISMLMAADSLWAAAVEMLPDSGF